MENNTIQEKLTASFGKSVFDFKQEKDIFSFEMDADKNGSVTKDEAKAHHEAKKAEWEKKKAEMKAKGEMPADVPADAPKAE